MVGKKRKSTKPRIKNHTSGIMKGLITVSGGTKRQRQAIMNRFKKDLKEGKI